MKIYVGGGRGPVDIPASAGGGLDATYVTNNTGALAQTPNVPLVSTPSVSVGPGQKVSLIASGALANALGSALNTSFALHNDTLATFVSGIKSTPATSDALTLSDVAEVSGLTPGNYTFSLYYRDPSVGLTDFNKGNATIVAMVVDQ